MKKIKIITKINITLKTVEKRDTAENNDQEQGSPKKEERQKRKTEQKSAGATVAEQVPPT